MGKSTKQIFSRNLLSLMDKRIIEQIQNNTSQIQTPVKQSEIKPYEELKEIKELYDMGILTDEEYTAKKKQLLGI